MRVQQASVDKHRETAVIEAGASCRIAYDPVVSVEDYHRQIPVQHDLIRPVQAVDVQYTYSCRSRTYMYMYMF